MKESEFFHQLGLLVNAKLPLPEAFKAMAHSYKSRSAVFLKVQSLLDEGKLLSEALDTAGGFSKEAVELIKSAEQNDTLEKTLSELARYSHLERTIVKLVKEVMVYPLFVCLLTFLSAGLLSRYVLSDYEVIIHELLDGESIKGFTSFTWKVTNWIDSNFLLYNLVLGVLTLLFILLFSGKLNLPFLNSAGFKICSLWTGLPYYFYSSKLCSYLSLHFKNKSELHKVMDSSCAFVGNTYLRYDLKKAAKNLESGQSVEQTVEQMNNTDPLIKYTLSNCDSDNSGEEFEDLANTFYERCFFISQRLIFYWQVILVIFVSAVIWVTTYTILGPIFQLLRSI